MVGGKRLAVQGLIIGYRKDQRPIYSIQGASETAPEPPKVDPPEFTPIQSQDDLNKVINDRLRREREKFSDYEDAKRKASEFDKLQEKNKTDLEKEQTRATEAEKRAEAAEAKTLKAEVALAKGIPAKFLVGSTKEELEAHADELIAFRGEQKPGKQTIPSLTPGEEQPKKGAAAAGIAEAQRRFSRDKK